LMSQTWTIVLRIPRLSLHSFFFLASVIIELANLGCHTDPYRTVSID
jgi:hypothetical protein